LLWQVLSLHDTHNKYNTMKFAQQSRCTPHSHPPVYLAIIILNMSLCEASKLVLASMDAWCELGKWILTVHVSYNGWERRQLTCEIWYSFLMPQGYLLALTKSTWVVHCCASAGPLVSQRCCLRVCILYMYRYTQV